MTARTVKNATTDAVISTESFTYDAAGNITGGSADTTFVYDTNNRLVTYNGNAVSYDLDGNMLNNGSLSCTYDSANRLLTAGGNTYTYNAEDVRIKNVHYGVEEKYTYDTNCKLSKMLTRTVSTTVTKYVYGHGLISEETNNTVKVYHFDYRGSTVAVTDSTGAITDTFEYDTYGKIIARTGTSDIIFCYNGRDGVVIDTNGLFYMRARYYSPDMRRFINADILHGKISDSTSLNRYSYVNGNPVSFVDPFGLERKEPYDYGEYKALLIKTFKMAKEALASYAKDLGKKKDSVVAGYEDVYNKLLYAIENDLAPDEFIDGIKVQFVIETNFNTSGNELLMELAGYVPVLDIIALFVQLDSMEDADLPSLFELGFGVVDESGMGKFVMDNVPKDVYNVLSFLGGISDIITFAEVIETLYNWNSSDKVGTEIHLHIAFDNFIYQYHAIVDKDLYFTEMYSGWTGLVIKPEDDMFEIRFE